MGYLDAVKLVGPKQTDAFIKMNPIQVAFIRDVYVPDGSGGLIPNPEQPTILLPQTMRKISAQIASNQAPVRETQDGHQTSPHWYLYCYADVDVQLWDECVADGDRLQVVFINTNTFDRVICECVERV